MQYLMVWRQSERWLVITDTQSDCFLLSNELSARINGFDLIDVVPMNLEDHQLWWQKQVVLYPISENTGEPLVTDVQQIKANVIYIQQHISESVLQ